MPRAHMGHGAGQGEIPREPPRGLATGKEKPMRNRIVRIRVSDAELSALKSLSAARGLSLSDLLRRVALNVRMPARRFDQADAAILVRTLGELGRIGGNLNQLVRRANVGKLAGHDADLTTTLAGIDSVRSRIREIVA